MNKVLVCGAGGFIGSHLVKRLKELGNYVIGVDLHEPEYWSTVADEFHIADLTVQENVYKIVTPDLYEIYQLAADMGGAGYVFVGSNDANIMRNNVSINTNILQAALSAGVNRIFYSSSACVYPEYNQLDPNNPICSEHSAYPADPDSDYGLEKLFSERLYLSHARNYGLHVRIARFHNVFGPYGSWNDGREKAPAALCRKVAQANNEVEIWGGGDQTRSFLFIDECLDGIIRIMNSTVEEPLNLGSKRMITINGLAHLISELENKKISIVNVPGPTGVNGRVSDNKLIAESLGWEPQDNLEYGLRITYKWILNEIDKGS